MSASEDMGVTPSGTEPGGPLTVKTVRSLGIQERIPPAGEVVKITENEGPVQANSAQEPLEEPGSIEGKGPWNEGTVASEVQPTLFCPKERISHVWMVISGKTACSSCKQKLLLDREFEARASDLGTPTKDKSQKAQEDGQFISHFVAYLDDGGEQITKVSWPEPFDIAKARRGLPKKPTVFEVHTVLQTSIPKQPLYSGGWNSYAVREVLDAGILENPGIAVNIQTTTLQIQSQTIIKAISRVASYYPSVNFEGATLKLEEPYMVIAHHLRELEEYCSYPAGPESIGLNTSSDGIHSGEIAPSHIRLLLDFVKDIHKSFIADEEARHTHNACTFPMLWLLFKPGTTVYVESEGRLSAYVVKSVEVDNSVLRLSRDRLQPCVINMWNLDYDGRFVGRSPRSVTIGQFEGERQITSLKVVPCEFIDRNDGGQTRERLETRGQHWYDLLRGERVRYAGELLRGRSAPEVDRRRSYRNKAQRALPPGDYERARTPPPRLYPPLEERSHPAPRGFFEGRIYVDLASYYAEEQGVAPEVGEVDDMGEGLAVCTCEECKGWRPHPHPSFRWAQYDVLDPVQERDLVLKDSPEGPRHRYLLCNWVLAGSILKSRTWECLDVANCLAPKANSRAMDTLVMPTERKDMIKALIQKFSTASTPSKTWGADFVENKGEGQIFLLHGSPGVGKTYTAECIAEYTGRALLSLTCADFGIDEERMEQQLSKWFRLAEKWGAVMLIDEADVFLERRHVSDLKRNSLVSVFLRCIEYYRGFLFLTTNRVGHFDDALISRIHVIIRYDNLGEKERNKIWTQFFDKLSDERENFRIMGRAKAYVLEDDIMRRMEWNGREIRNVFQTAVALAEYRFSQKEHKTKDDHPTLDQKDFEQVCQMTRQFKEYLVNIHGIDEEARAFHHKDRAGYGHAL